MAGSSWMLWLLLSAAGVVGSVVWYRRRELPGRGRMLLAVLRAASLSLVLLLLFDPELRAGAARGGATQVLLDASLSMTLPADGGTRWDAAVARARALRGERPVLLFGDVVRPAARALPDSAPGDARTRLLPALQAAAESGARRVVVITDGGIEDVAAVTRWLPRLGLEVELERVGADVANRSLVEVSGPQWVQAGEVADIEFGVSGATSDSVTVVARRGGRVIGRTSVPAAAAGRMATGSIRVRLEAPEGGGPVPVELALDPADAVPADDRRMLYVEVSEQPAGITLVSLRPDWEPRFLAPVLEQALGIPLRAYLRGATGQYVRLAGGLQAGTPVAEDEVRRAAVRGELLVLHGLGVDAPAWAFEAARTARRLLLFPGDGAAEALPFQVGPEQEGDFFPLPAIPASPVAPLLAGLELDGAAPLAALRPAELPADAWVPLHVTRGRQGAPLPALVAGGQGGRRWVTVLATGWWHWAFRGGAERQAYARLWSALAGWLAHEPGTAAGAVVRPARLALPRAAPVPWLTPGTAADSLALTLRDTAGAVVLDTVVSRTAGDTLFTRAPAPGTYSWRARAFAGEAVLEAEGGLTVESYSPELTRPRVAAGALAAAGQTVRGAGVERGRGTPLHTTPWPYILLVLMLAAEWILRRRWGLR